MKYIKKYEGMLDFLKRKNKVATKEDILKKLLMSDNTILSRTNIKYKINDDESFDVLENVYLSRINNEYLNLLKSIKFKNIEGDFSIRHINNLKYLPDSCPEYVSGEFSCNSNGLLSLNNSPKEVGGNFRCDQNNLSTFEDGPEKVDGMILFQNNNIYNFDFFPKVFRVFACEGNPIYDVCRLFMKLSNESPRRGGINTFDDKGEVDVFNAYDPIKPPENIGDKPILYLDILSLFLDEYKVTDIYSMKVLYEDINIVCNNIFKNYKVINSNGTECKMIDLGRLIISNIGILSEVFKRNQ